MDNELKEKIGQLFRDSRGSYFTHEPENKQWELQFADDLNLLLSDSGYEIVEKDKIHLTKDEAQKLSVEVFKLSDQQFTGMGKFYIDKTGNKLFHYWNDDQEILKAIKPQLEYILKEIKEEK